MTAPLASALQQPPAKVSRFSGRPVATRADGKPAWIPRKDKEENDERSS